MRMSVADAGKIPAMFGLGKGGQWISTKQVEAVIFAELCPEFLESNSPLPISIIPQQSNHFAECPEASKFGNRLSDQSADDRLKKAVIGRAVSCETQNSIQRVERQVLA